MADSLREIIGFAMIGTGVLMASGVFLYYGVRAIVRFVTRREL